MTALLLVVSLAQFQWEKPDELSTFRIRMEDGRTDFGKVDVLQTIQLAHRLFLKADLDSDKKPRHYENGLTIRASAVQIAYRSRVSLTLHRESGLLLGFGVHTPDAEQVPNLSPEDCVAKAAEWYRAAGGTHETVLERSEIDVLPQRVYVKLAYVASGTPHRFQAGVETYIDRTHGFPAIMWVDPLPAYDPPRRIVAKEQAVANAVAAAAEFTGWKLLEAASQDAAYHVPAYSKLPNRLSERHRARASAGRAGLVYEVSVNDGRYEWKQGEPRPFVQVYVDAETGEPIALLPVVLMRGGSGAAERPFSWGGTWTVDGVSGAVEPTAGDPPVRGRPVSLSRGSIHAAARFDAKSGVVWLEREGVVLAGLPDAALRRALSRAKPVPPFAMKPPAADAR
jgi:hypothetical protein